ncbi:hypothetical protein [Streptomyces sp. S.PB5]|uniref:hypothetical protein n=1 Tax=Streptomyces sp. S.PB5 TaxID=3020844 RepID=UPI0025AFEF65|nr:hypothetical protein [Streptomyces sp. S.PB5]MDN3029681.1 hypothetical protein [Streptomyces sp. S.PB5]
MDIARAVDQRATAEPTDVDFGLIRWADGERPPVTRSIAHGNKGSGSVTFRLKHNASHQAGNSPAPPGLFRLGADSVTVPAHRMAAVSFTVPPEATDVHKPFSGDVSATTTTACQ